MIVSMSEAAKLAGVSRQTIYRKAKNGELSTTRKPDGSKGVDTSELERALGTITVKEPNSSETEVTVTPETESDIVVLADTARVTDLERDLAAAQSTIKHQDERIAELKSDKDKLWVQVESQRLLLEHKDKPQQPEGVPWSLVAVLGMAGVVLAMIAFMGMR